MSKPIIAIFQSLHADQKEQLVEIAKNYEVIFADKNADLINDQNLDEIVIAFGWNQEIGQKILASPTSQLKWLQTVSAGVDMLDLKTFADKNILITNASGIHAEPIAESVVGTLLTQYRNIRQSIQNQTKHIWQNANMTDPTDELNHKKALIVGTGQIGKQLAKLLHGFDVQIFGINRSGHPVDHFEDCYPQAIIDQILPTMDIVINILPLTNETADFYNTKRFSKMKSDVFFINVGRGKSVVTADLIVALTTKQIGFAALDVFDEEPLPNDSPLWDLENVLITPHISGVVPHFKQVLFPIFRENLQQFLKDGTVCRNQINTTLGY